MKVLMLSTDPKILDAGSAVSLRIIAYGALTEGIQVLAAGGAIRERKILTLSPKVKLLAVTARLRFLRPFALVYAGFRLRKEGFSLITVQDPFETGLAGLILSWFLSIPLDAQIHTDFLNPYFPRHSLLNRLRIILTYLILPRAALVRVVSERIRQSITARYLLPPHRVVVLPVMSFPSQAPQEPVHLKERYPDFTSFSLVVSRFEPEKNLRGLLEAFAEVSLGEKDAALILVGDGGERNSLERQVRKLRLEKRVIFEGWQAPTPYYLEADLYILNSFFEGYGLTLVEAARAGCPILTTAVGIVGEVITEENALVVPPGDTDALARAWREALTNPELMRQKAEKAKEALRRHLSLSPDAYAKALTDLWRRACAGSF